MAVEERRSGGNGFLYFAVGALIVAVIALGWMFYSGETQRSPTESAVERMADSVDDAADAIGDSAREAADNIPAPESTPAQPPG